MDASNIIVAVMSVAATYISLGIQLSELFNNSNDH